MTDLDYQNYVDIEDINDEVTRIEVFSEAEPRMEIARLKQLIDRMKNTMRFNEQMLEYASERIDELSGGIENLWGKYDGN